MDDLELLNQELLPALSHARIVEADHGFTWDWADDRQTLDRMLWPVARSAAELLSSAQLNRARQCADDRCGWLFLDMSRNRSRRWCSMTNAATATRPATTTGGSETTTERRAAARWQISCRDRRSGTAVAIDERVGATSAPGTEVPV